jgi:hypothetical protein
MANIARQEANYEKLCTTIERTQRRWEKADKAAARLLKKLAALERQRSRARRRLDRVKAEAKAAALHPEPELPKPELPKDGGIPEFLDRSKKLQALPNPRTKEKKAERRAVEKEVREAELRGKRRKMPLSGKDALKAIHSN